jgi:hypothetical protein
MNRRWIVLPVLGVALGGWVVSAREPEKAEPGKEAAGKKVDALAPEVTGLRLTAGQRVATAEARHGALGYTSAPLIEVVQPRADAIVVTMSGTAAAGGLPCETSSAELVFDLSQAFTVHDDRPGARTAPRPIRLVLEAQLVGMFRGNRDGAGVAAITVPAEAFITAGGMALAHVGLPGRSHCGKDTLLISDRSPAVEALVPPGEYALNQKITIRCSHPKKCFHKNVVMAVFGDTGRAPDWLNLLDPVRDLPKGRDLGFRVAVRAESAPPPVPQPIPVMPPPMPRPMQK